MPMTAERNNETNNEGIKKVIPRTIDHINLEVTPEEILLLVVVRLRDLLERMTNNLHLVQIIPTR